jgi:NTE family protein
MWPFKPRYKKRILVLGGGSARGLCNIGALKVLEKYFGRDNLPFDMMIGTSIGSLIGAAYCMGMPIEELEEKAMNFTWQSLVDFGIYSTGMVKGDKLEEVIRGCIHSKGFADLKIPFALTTTDIETGEERTHTSGDLIKLIRASCSWPGVFTAVEINGRKLVDGGVRNSVPTKAARKFGADFIVAVNPGFSVKRQKVDNVIKATIQAVQIMGEELNEYQASSADVVIKPVLENVDQFDFDQAELIIRHGELAAEVKMKSLMKKMGHPEKRA